MQRPVLTAAGEVDIAAGRTGTDGGWAVTRALALAAAVGATLAGGCASGWETLSSRRFRESPFKTMWGKEDDPLTVLRTDPIGDNRARAMQRLVEPAADGRAAEQDEAVQLLAQAAATDPSPWVRLVAVDALGRFKDPRAADALVAAYHAAPGKTARGSDSPRELIQTAADRKPISSTGLAELRGPQGFPADQVSGLRVRVLDALAKHSHVGGVELLVQVATGRDQNTGDDSITHELVRQAAVRNLGSVRKPEAVTALAKVLSAESGRDITVATLAHDGLRTLTGKDLPADPREWDAVVQAGATVVPAGNAIQRAVGLDVSR